MPPRETMTSIRNAIKTTDMTATHTKRRALGLHSRAEESQVSVASSVYSARASSNQQSTVATVWRVQAITVQRREFVGIERVAAWTAVARAVAPLTASLYFICAPAVALHHLPHLINICWRQLPP